MWTEQAVFIELGKIYISAMKVMEAMNMREGLVGWGGGCVHGKGQREKKEGLKWYNYILIKNISKSSQISVPLQIHIN